MDKKHTGDENMTQEAREAILEPYWTWSPTRDQLFAALGRVPNHFDIDDCPDVLALNGPPKSGKGFLARYLSDLCGATVIKPIDSCYAAMRAWGLPDTERSYDEFKALPLGRSRLIAAHDRVCRFFGPHIWDALAVADPYYMASKFVVIDCVGRQAEYEFFRGYAKRYAGVTLFSAYTEDGRWEVVPVDEHGLWYGDSRTPISDFDVSGYVGSQHFIYSLQAREVQGRTPPEALVHTHLDHRKAGITAS